MIDGAVVSAGVISKMVIFLGDAWPLVVPMVALAVVALVVAVIKGVL